MADVVWDASKFNDAYRVTDRNPASPTWGQVFGYSRRAMECFANPYGNDLKFYKNALDVLGAAGVFTPSSYALFVGAGYGFILEEAANNGADFSRVWGLEPSQYIHDTAGGEADATTWTHVLQARITDANLSTLLSAAGAGDNKQQFDVVVTEEVASSIDPAGFTAFLDACEARVRRQGVGVVHLVYTNATPIDPSLGLRTLSLEEWAAIRPAHYWYARNEGYRMLGGG